MLLYIGFALLLVYIRLVLRTFAPIRLTPRLQQWLSSGSYHTYKGDIRVYYREHHSSRSSLKADRNKILLLLHGFPSSSFDWHVIWQPLCDNFDQIVAPDFIGFGYSDKPSSFHYSIMSQTDMIIDLLSKRLDTTRVNSLEVLSHDYGVSVAQELIARHDEGSLPSWLRIHRTAFLNGGLIAGQHRPRLIQRLLHSPLGTVLKYLVTQRSFARSFNQLFGANKLSPVELSEYWSLNKYHGGLRVVNKLLHYMRDRRVHGARWLSALHSRTVSILVVNGPADPVSGAHLAEAVRRQVPSARVISLRADIGHYPQLEDSINVLNRCLEFFNAPPHE